MQEAIWTSSSEAVALARELGRLLRKYRTDAGMEIPELALRTRIGAGYLRSMEEGDLGALPGPIFVKGFLRSVCAELGRDPVPLMDLIDRMKVDEVQEETDAANGNGSLRTAPLVLSGVLLVGLITGGILLHGGRGADELKPTPAAAGVPSPEPAEDSFARQESPAEFDLLLRATEKTWLRIQADSSEAWETTMKAGDEIRLKAVDRVALFIGNAGGLLFELNGKRFGPLGTHGQVIANYIITRDNL